MNAEATPKRASTFGIIAIIVGVLLFMTPRFLISLGMMALAVFVIIGLIRDGNKAFSLIGMGLGGLIFYFLMHEYIASGQLYTVRYEAECSACELHYTNATGGTGSDKKGFRGWSESIQAERDQLVHFSVQNSNNTDSVRAKIYVNGTLIADETSSGENAIAIVSCQPKDVTNH